VRSALLSTMRDIDLVACLRAGGLTDENENIIRDRLLSA